MAAARIDRAFIPGMITVPEIGEKAMTASRTYVCADETIRVLGVTERQGATVVTVLVDGDYAQFRVMEPFELDWYFTVTGGKISALTMIEEKKPAPKKGKSK